MQPSNLRTHLALFLVAWILAVVVWLSSVQGELDTTWITVPVEPALLDAPDNVIVQSTEREVEINVRFAKSDRDRMVARNFELEIDLSKIFSGDPAQWPNPTEEKREDFPLSYKAVRGPESAQVQEVDPPKVPLRARLRTALVAVDVKTTGTLPSRWRLPTLQAEPSTLLVTGSQAALDALAQSGNRLDTAPIPLNTVIGPIRQPSKLLLPEGIRTVDSTGDRIHVVIGVEEVITSRTIERVPISVLVLDRQLEARPTPAFGSITVRGPYSAVESLSFDRLRIVPVKNIQEKTGTLQVAVGPVWASPAQAVRGVELVECAPKFINVEITPSVPQSETGNEL